MVIDFEHYTLGSGKRRMKEIDMSFECEVIIYLYTKILTDLERLLFEPSKRMVKFW